MRGCRVGAFGVIRQGERSVMIMLQRRRLEDLAPEELARDLDYLARKADWGENKLSEIDRN